MRIPSGPVRGAPSRALSAPLIVMLLLAVGITLACRSASHACAVCGRHECGALAFRVEYGDGEVLETCCPKCASRAVAEQPTDRGISRLEASDFVTGEPVDAHIASYVEGSDFEPCSRPQVERAEGGCCRERDYDRCLPSLIAFRSPEAARSFVTNHGGRLRSFEDLAFGQGVPAEGR